MIANEDGIPDTCPNKKMYHSPLTRLKEPEMYGDADQWHCQSTMMRMNIACVVSQDDYVQHAKEKLFSSVKT
jgi:hypothetical protein